MKGIYGAEEQAAYVPYFPFHSVSSCLHGTVQLVGGVTPYGGRLQICNNGKWATVCSTNFGSVSASVICKQLLGENASKFIFQIKIMIYETEMVSHNIIIRHSVILTFMSFTLGAVWTHIQYFGLGSSTSILDDLTCTGTESSISQCTYTEVRDFRAARCYHYRDVMMVCYGIQLPPKSACTQFLK